MAAVVVTREWAEHAAVFAQVPVLAACAVVATCQVCQQDFCGLQQATGLCGWGRFLKFDQHGNISGLVAQWDNHV